MSKDKEVDKLFIRLYQKLDAPLVNDSNFLLGIDLLRNELKIELLKIITVLVEKTFLDLAKGSSKYSISLKGKNILMELVTNYVAFLQRNVIIMSTTIFSVL